MRALLVRLCQPRDDLVGRRVRPAGARARAARSSRWRAPGWRRRRPPPRPRERRRRRPGTSTARRRPTRPPRGRRRRCEYVAQRPLPILQAPQVELPELTPLRPGRARKRPPAARARPPRSRSSAARTTTGVPARAPCAGSSIVRDVVEDERAPRAGRRPRPRRRSREPAAPSRRTTALSHARPSSPGSGASTSTSGAQLPQLVRRPAQERKRPVVARDAAADAEELERDGRLLRPHRVVVADRQDGDVRLVDPPDQLHVAEDARVAGEVELRPVLHLDDEPGGLARVRARPEQLLECLASVSVILMPSPLDRAALVGRLGRPSGARASLAGEPARAAPPGRSPGSSNRCASSTVSPTWSSWPWVSAIRSIALGLLLALGALRVPEPRIDVDALAARRVDAEARVPEPGDRRVRP